MDGIKECDKRYGKIYTGAHRDGYFVTSRGPTMILFKDLTGPKLKRELPVVSARRRYHNQNKSGGNFGINLIRKQKPHFELVGAYDMNGVVYRLSVSELWQPGMNVINIDNFDSISHEVMFHKIENYMK